MNAKATFDYSLLEFGLSDRMRKAQDVAQISNADMAEYIGVSRFTVSRYLNGASEPPLAVLRAWAMCTGVPFEWLQTGKTPDGGEPVGGSVVRHQGLEPRTH
ncbi:helix-turn-helix transcriptional regulator [Corynebacterium hindlerae]|uniref:Helix-turn-helix transcriptional regulator n=1 Tax=Corynebacterium hindlerae TaxID=699041 RepID=A0A7G5FDQ3_9CORY|nr:helix-turn-helix transcriptional regulator [Corynebacterium hindlerae]QMV84744.1 helix-turn-helix transcriptional regulator [Corynebacterium hindlerae]